MNIKKDLFNYWIKCYCYNNDIILPIKRKIGKKSFSNAILLVILPILLMRWFLDRLYERLFAIKYVEEQKKEEAHKSFKYNFGIVAIAKNEGIYLKEWIEYHRIIGVTVFYIYDNESNDDTSSILEPYIEKRLVYYKFVKGKAKQLEAYNDAIRKYRFDCKYMAFIDLDEYLFIDREESITQVTDEILKKSPKGAVGIGVNWAIFGNSNYKTSPQGLITESYIYRSEEAFFANQHIKTICNPRMVSNYISPHYPMYKLGAFSVSSDGRKRLWGWFNRDVNWANIRINHYYCKSQEDYLHKIGRGLGDRLGNYDTSKYNLLNRNEVLDEGMLKYQKELSECVKNEIIHNYGRKKID